MAWPSASFAKLFIDRTGGNRKLKRSDYIEEGLLPIIDQGQEFVSGYTNDMEARCHVRLPCILFGDHTKVFKYVECPFVLGADGVKVLEPVDDLNARYAYYYLGQVRLGGKEGYQRNFKYLKSIAVPLPPLPIQKQIAAILEKADAVREKRRKANELTDQFLQSAFLEMFGDPVTNPKGWETGLVSDCVEYAEYGTSERSNDLGEGYPIIGMGNITSNGQLDLSKMKHVRLSESEFSRLRLQHGDVIFNRTNSRELVGKTTHWNLSIDAVIASYLVKLRLSHDFSPAWFSALFNTVAFKKLFMQRCKKAVGQSNISPTLLKQFPIYKPPLTEQLRYAALVESVEYLRTKQQDSGKELDSLFNSLMQRAFGGKLVNE